MNQEKELTKTITIIPNPVEQVEREGKFVLNDETIIECDAELRNIGEYLKKMLIPATGVNVKIKIFRQKDYSNNSIVIKINKELKNLGTEGYNFQITRKNILISAPAASGVFYGIQSLHQLLPAEIEKINEVNYVEWSVPCVEIEDYPRFSWRGCMLDEGRHFLGKDVVKKMLDLMAFLKMNVFHWHLTEDQGWRIEIKKYPKLTEIGSKRNSSQVGGFVSKKEDGIPHEGYYTQGDIEEIVSYAAERFIKVIPEIEMPGHCMAALTAYPEMSCTGGPFKVPSRFGIKKDVYCVGKEKVFDFLQDILNEVMALFPSEIVHIGGDEVPKARWKKCADCQARIKAEGLEDEKDLQNYFTNRIATYLSSRGRIAMGWNQILNNKLPSDAIAQYWMLDKKKVIKHLTRGRKIVMSKFGRVYLDYGYAFTPLRKTYAYEPVPKELKKQHHKNILGVEATMWTEWVPNAKRLYWQLFPRLIAVAETGWTQKEKKDYNSFKMRLDMFLKRLEYLGINHALKEEIDPGFFKTLFGFLTIFKAPTGGT